jgi:AAA+ superfamily predicted ATPase
MYHAGHTSRRVDSIDSALMPQFDLNLKFDVPGLDQIKDLIKLTLKSGKFCFDNALSAATIEKLAQGLSYYRIQKTLISAIKHSLIKQRGEQKTVPLVTPIDTDIWKTLIADEKEIIIKQSL